MGVGSQGHVSAFLPAANNLVTHFTEGGLQDWCKRMWRTENLFLNYQLNA